MSQLYFHVKSAEHFYNKDQIERKVFHLHTVDRIHEAFLKLNMDIFLLLFQCISSLIQQDELNLCQPGREAEKGRCTAKV